MLGFAALTPTYVEHAACMRGAKACNIARRHETRSGMLGFAALTPTYLEHAARMRFGGD